VFKKATKAQSKLRAAIYGPAGSGKTFTSLSVATGLGKRIALIDTEHGSASKYSDRFNFDTCVLKEKTLSNYVRAIGEAVEGKYDVLIIDSLTHAWKDLLEEVDLLTKTKYRGNSWSAWSEGTPKQRSCIDAILGAPGYPSAARPTWSWKLPMPTCWSPIPRYLRVTPSELAC